MADAPNTFIEFKALADEFERNPTLENYVTLRRRFPGLNVEAARFASFDPLVAMRHHLEAARINPLTVCDVLDGDDRAIDELSLQLMQRLIERGQLECDGKTHLQRRKLGISDALVDYLIVTMLEAIEHYGATLNSSLLVLIRDRLGGPNPIFHQQIEKKQRRNDAIFIGVQLRMKKKKPSIRRVAELMGVKPSTLSRWFPAGDFVQEVERMQKLLARPIVDLVRRRK